jgi:hypothetical protein
MQRWRIISELSTVTPDSWRVSVIRVMSLVLIPTTSTWMGDFLCGRVSSVLLKVVENAAVDVIELSAHGSRFVISPVDCFPPRTLLTGFHCVLSIYSRVAIRRFLSDVAIDTAVTHFLNQLDTVKYFDV